MLRGNSTVINTSIVIHVTIMNEKLHPENVGPQIKYKLAKNMKQD